MTPLNREKSAALLAGDKQFISPSLGRDGQSLYIERGKGCYLHDVDGNDYLDFSAGIAVNSTGYGHERVLLAVRGQIERFLHLPGTTTGYAAFSKIHQQLATIHPNGKPAKVFLANSGTEAIEAAFKLVRHRTGRKQVIAFLSGFHGRTMGALSLTASKLVQKRRFFPLVPGVTHVPFADCYRCVYGKEQNTCAVECVRFIEENLFQSSLPPEEVAAIFLEPIQGEGGYVFPPKKFFDRLSELASRHEILLVADEIQSGMGRTGKMLASEHFGFVPDIVAIGKGIASGLPMGAIIAPAEVMNWEKGAHASTFSGNAVGCAAAVETFKLLKEELIANSAAMGKLFQGELRKRFSEHPKVGDIRGLGLMIAMEIVVDKTTKIPDVQARDRIIAKSLDRGLITMGCGKSVIRFTPPLIVGNSELERALAVLDAVMLEE